MMIKKLKAGKERKKIKMNGMLLFSDALFVAVVVAIGTPPALFLGFG